jgi:hypothetical protein
MHLLPRHTDTAWLRLLRLEDCLFSYVFFQRFLQVSIQSDIFSWLAGARFPMTNIFSI